MRISIHVCRHADIAFAQERFCFRGLVSIAQPCPQWHVHCNDLLSSETIAMVKERLIENCGVPFFTIGTGGSGGAYQSHQTGDNYPGLVAALGDLDDDAMPQLFGPFFTTKEQGSGLGLGLVISAGIVREFGGTLRAENRRAVGVSGDPGDPDNRDDIVGARFIVQLPAAQETHADAN